MKLAIAFTFLLAACTFFTIIFVNVQGIAREEARLARKEFNLRVMAGECLVVDRRVQDGVSSTYWACSAGRMRTGWLED